MKVPFSAHHHPLEIVRHFTPNWFAMVMGTGITALCLNTLSHFIPEVKNVATLIWLWNIGLFMVFSLLLITKSFIVPKTWSRMLSHESQPLFLGCIPMGLITIVNGFIVFGIPLMGEFALKIALVLWWLDVALSLFCVLIIPHYIFTQHQHNNLLNMSALWLLPFVTCEVAAASGGFLVPLLSTLLALKVLFLSLMLWAISMALALSILVIYFQRLCVHKMPDVNVATSIWLPLGPTGTGTLAILLLGHNAQSVASPHLSPAIITMLQLLPGIGLFLGLVLWALASWWFVMAIGGTYYYLRHKPKFSLGFWAYIFPLGVYTMATYILAGQTQMLLFQVFAILLVIALTTLWVFVSMRSLHGAYHGYLFQDPMLVIAD